MLKVYYYRLGTSTFRMSTSDLISEDTTPPFSISPYPHFTLLQLIREVSCRQWSEFIGSHTHTRTHPTETRAKTQSVPGPRHEVSRYQGRIEKATNHSSLTKLSGANPLRPLGHPQPPRRRLILKSDKQK